ncbi:hypothetical protein J5X84_28415 [Streptosporangiaceae bacterium NEAU-GS5]|nr:hypothetical protein [Streptosporangiaceae bacterium NEAU-GS5]
MADHGLYSWVGHRIISLVGSPKFFKATIRCAGLTPGAVAVLNRFELVVDGIEVAHGYEDETDRAEFLARATQVGLLDVGQGRVPAASVGLRIGIERLCAAATNLRDMSAFRNSVAF